MEGGEMDIDDILADAERGALAHHEAQNRDPFSNDYQAGGFRDDANGDTAQEDLRALTRAWVNERGAPEVLGWPENNLIERVSERIKRQIEKVEEMTGDMDPKTNFGLIVVQTELERWKYLVRGFLRARLAKIDKHTLHYLSTPALTSRLSPAELSYATRHQALLHQHYLSSFLGGFPPNLQNLNDTAGGISMIGGPEEDGGVLVRGTGESYVYEARGRDRDGGVEVERGEVVVARWGDVREGVVGGELELV